MTPIRKFVILLRCGMGLKRKDGQQTMPDIDGEEEWRLMMELAREQTVQGVVGRGIRMMPEDQCPPREIYRSASVLNEKIALLNRRVDAACLKVAEHYSHHSSISKLIEIHVHHSKQN